MLEMVRAHIDQQSALTEMSIQGTSMLYYFSEMRRSWKESVTQSTEWSIEL